MLCLIFSCPAARLAIIGLTQEKQWMWACCLRIGFPARSVPWQAAVCQIPSLTAWPARSCWQKWTGHRCSSTCSPKTWPSRRRACPGSPSSLKPGRGSSKARPWSVASLYACQMHLVLWLHAFVSKVVTSSATYGIKSNTFEMVQTYLSSVAEKSLVSLEASMGHLQKQ